MVILRIFWLNFADHSAAPLICWDSFGDLFRIWEIEVVHKFNKLLAVASDKPRIPLLLFTDRRNRITSVVMTWIDECFSGQGKQVLSHAIVQSPRIATLEVCATGSTNTASFVAGSAIR